MAVKTVRSIRSFAADQRKPEDFAANHQHVPEDPPRLRARMRGLAALLAPMGMRLAAVESLFLNITH